MNTEYVKHIILHLFNPLRDKHKQSIRYDLLFLKEVFFCPSQETFNWIMPFFLSLRSNPRIFCYAVSYNGAVYVRNA